MKKIRKDVYIFLIISVLLLILASFYDLTISSFVYNRNSLFCRSIHVISQIPSYVLLSFFSMGIYNTRNRDGSFKSALSAFLGVCGTLVFGFLVGYVFLYNLGLYSITMSIAIDIGIYVCCFIVTKLSCDHDEISLRNVSIVGLLSYLACVCICLLIVSIISRAPYRRLDGLVNIFSSWYDPFLEFDITGFMHRSFPSIVVLISSFTLFINFFSDFSRYAKKRKIIIRIGTYSWVFLVSICQLVLGYAYLSDVAISLLLVNLISTFIFCIFNYIKSNESKKIEE